MKFNQKGYTEIVTVSLILGIIGSLFIAGVFVWQEINGTKEISRIQKIIKNDETCKDKDNSYIKELPPKIEPTNTSLVFFLREDEQYVLYSGSPTGEKEKTGFSMPVLKTNATGEWVDLEPDWLVSPDGKKIVYKIAVWPENHSLRIVSIDGQNDELLYKQEGSSTSIGLGDYFWNNDSNTIFFVKKFASIGGSSETLYKIDASTKKYIEIGKNDYRLDALNKIDSTKVQRIPIYK